MAAGQGGPDPAVLSGRAPILGVFPKRGVAGAREQLQNGCCPFLVLWHHPVAAGRGLSLPCHRHASLEAGVTLGTEVVPRASSAASGSAGSSGEEASRSPLSPANRRGGHRGERAAARPDPPLKFAPCARPKSTGTSSQRLEQTWLHQGTTQETLNFHGLQVVP